MKTWIALLRAVNVGGRNLVRMSDLRDLLAASGHKNARTLLQSGNAVFQAQGKSDAELEKALERATEKRLGVATDYFVRTSEEWESIVTHNPFRAEAKRDPARLIVVFMKDAPKPKDVKALQAAIQGPEVVRSWAKQLYAVYPDGMGRSKLTITRIERQLGSRGTARNWNTVLKLAAMTQD